MNYQNITMTDNEGLLFLFCFVPALLVIAFGIWMIKEGENVKNQYGK